MSFLRTALLIASVVRASGGNAALFGSEPTDQIRETVQRSIPYIQERGASWIQEKKCVSCHRVNTMVWSLGEARRHRFETSGDSDDWLEWATDASLSKNDKGTVVGIGNKEGVAQILLSLDGDPSRNNIRSELASLLLEGQQPNGSWNPGGQLPSQKRPKSETADVSTMWITLALIHAGSKQETAPAIEQAMSYIEKSPPGESTEWYTVRLLLAVARNDQESRVEILKKLREHQQSDGGWGWLIGEKSDALGTGLAMYALVHGGADREDIAVKRAQQFLISTQRKDGSWAVHGTKANKKDSIEETAVYWGTTWASLGLMAGLPAQE